ncbi:MAG: DEAD/DEAH box helicase family protein [Candidatus Cloacimonas sp.]|jgi:type III restriction enzyme|nr:DEAD/DEAH box helicase family protein [Candidatus Cloacimonas sp.]
MNKEVNAISGRLSLRPPQRKSLEILDRVTELYNIKAAIKDKTNINCDDLLGIIKAEYPKVTDFERDFPSLCFALATGVGKTRLMGAFITYLYRVYGIANYFVLAPNLTIYNKLQQDFTPNTPKYVFTGIAEFAINPPEIITGDNYNKQTTVQSDRAGQIYVDGVISEVRINIFNISKINSEVRGGKEPKIKRLSEYIGQSYFNYLASLPDLVLIMDESHRYRATAGARAINELKPILGLELTATPFVETTKGPVPFRNVIYSYPLARAMEDGFVKEPAVVTQKNFNPRQFTPEALEEIKLKDGVSLHEITKVELVTYARQNDKPPVKPFMLVIARDTTHASKLLELIKSPAFFEGRYRDKVIQVDSSVSGEKEDEMIERLLNVEKWDEPTEIVIHVNMLKEGWDVTNLYTIVPLRAANARILIEQSIGRGLRLPYGKRTGDTPIDRLNIVAHDKFQEIIEEANRADSVIRLTELILDPDEDFKGTISVVSAPESANAFQETLDQQGLQYQYEPVVQSVIFDNIDEKRIARMALEAIRGNESLPNTKSLSDETVQTSIIENIRQKLTIEQMELTDIVQEANIARIVAITTDYVINKTIDIPRIHIAPKGEVTIDYHPFKVDCSKMQFQPVSRELFAQTLRTNEQQEITAKVFYVQEPRLENYIVKSLIDFDDIAYDEHADFIYELAGQVANHFSSYLSSEGVTNVLVYFQKQIAEYVHAQMVEHQYEKTIEYEVVISKGFTELKKSAYTVRKDDLVQHFHTTSTEKFKIPSTLFGGYINSLYPIYKFHSYQELIMARILDRCSNKWFKPAKGQFQIYYKTGILQGEYVPDFVAETDKGIFMIEVKSAKDMESEVVQAKKTAAVNWCKLATEHSRKHNGKAWKYLLVPHDMIFESTDLPSLVSRFE